MRLAKLSADYIDLPTHERIRWLGQARDQHPDLASALLAMVSATSTAAPMPAPALALSPEDDPAPLATGDTIGPYRLIRVLGHGGMGVVWLAEQVDGRVQRQVALKLLAPQWVQGAWRLRFERERDILSTLSHPGLARLIDAGVSAQGQPYLSMEFVAGNDIVRHARQQALSPRACVALMVSLLEAVQHAHASLVVHRDLKPSNVLVDASGRVVLLDFGIATVLRTQALDGVAATSELTSLCGAAFTPDYASPEQVAGRPVGAATDIYSTGVILYELLAGQRPYRLRRSSRAAMEEAILENELRPPSQQVDVDWAHRLGWTPKRLTRELRGDLDAIVLKALQRDPAQRYVSAGAFAEDLQRWLGGRPVKAQNRSRWYVMRRVVSRNRWAVLGSAITLAGLSGGLAAALWQADVARTEARTAHATEAFLVELFRTNGLHQDAPAVAQMTTARELLERGSQRITSHQTPGLKDAPVVRLRLIDTLIQLNADLGLVSSVDDLEQQRLALIRELPGRDLNRLAAALVSAGRAAAAGNTRAHQAGALLDEAERLMTEGGTPSDAPMRGHLALGRMEAASEDQCQAWAYAQQAVKLLRPVAATDPLWIEALIGAAQSGAYCGTAEQAVAFGQEALMVAHAHDAPHSRADLAHHAMSQALARAGRLEESIHEARISVQLAREKHPPDQPSGADALNAAANLAEKLCEYAHPADALSVAESLLKHVGTSPADLDAAVSLKVRQAHALRQLSRLPEALNTLEQALSMMQRYEVAPAQRALLLDVQADALSASGQYLQADRRFAMVSKIKQALNHTGTTQNHRHIARRVEHELRQGHVLKAAELMRQMEVKLPPGRKASRRHAEWMLLQSEMAWLNHERERAEALARETVARLDQLPDPALVRHYKARALELLAKVSRSKDKGEEAKALLREAGQLRADMARIGFPP
ncbi:protein kinase [Limnohabitans sp.]|uniref:serine/threonine protein kinase n=1 Tax=Limnohabitans sp. TaxID=1907725 RepID=UPI0031FE17EA